MKKKILAGLGVVALFVAATVWAVVVAVAGTVPSVRDKPSAPTSNLSACKEAMRKQFRAAMTGDTTATRPPECNGVSDEDAQRLAYEVLDEEMAR